MCCYSNDIRPYNNYVINCFRSTVKLQGLCYYYRPYELRPLNVYGNSDNQWDYSKFSAVNKSKMCGY